MTKQTNHSPAFREKVFRIWLHNEQNATTTARLVEEKFGIKLPVSTVTRWRDRFEWEPKSLIYDNEITRMMRMSNDPLVKQLAMDDLETARALKVIEKLMREVLKNPKKHGLMPRTIKDTIMLWKFAREERERILNRPSAPANLTGTPQTVYNDNRIQTLKFDMESLPPGDKTRMLDAYQKTVNQQGKYLTTAREEAFTEDD